MSEYFPKEANYSSCLIKSHAGIKPTQRAAFCDEFLVESSCSVRKIQNSTVIRIKEIDSSKPQEIQSSLKRKIEELRSSFFSAQDSNVDNASEASCEVFPPQLSPSEDAVIIHSNKCTESKTVLPPSEITHGEFQFSSSIKGKQCLASISAQKLVSYSHKLQYNNVPKIQCNSNLKSQENDECSNTKPEREHHSQENHCITSSSLFSTTQDRHNGCSKKLKKSHSFELSDPMSQPDCIRVVSARNSSFQSFRGNPVKACSVLTLKPKDLHCRFKKQFDQLHSSFFSNEESCSASPEKKNSPFSSSDQNLCKAVKKITSARSSANVSESMKLGTVKCSNTKSLEEMYSCIHYSSVDSTINRMRINALSEAPCDEHLPPEASLRGLGQTVVNSDEAKTETCSNMALTHNGSMGNGDEVACHGNYFFPDFLANSERITNYNLESTSKVNFTNLICQVSTPADCEKTTSQTIISSNTAMQKMNFSRSKKQDLLHAESQDDLTIEADSASTSNQSKALLSVETESRSVCQKSCDVQLNSDYLLEVMPKGNKESSRLTRGTSFNLPEINPGIEHTENECKYLQPKNVELSKSEFEVFLPVEQKNSVSILETCDSKSKHEEESQDVALLLADLPDEFFSQPETVQKKETDEGSLADSKESFTSKFDNAQQNENQDDSVLKSKSKPSPIFYEIPFLTIKKGGAENETCSVRALVKLFIVDLFRMTPTFRRNHYMFHNLIVHRVDIFGVVTGVRLVGDSKIIYEVDDGSGTISCMHRITKQVTRLKELKDFLHRTENDEILNQTEDTIMNESSIEQGSQEIVLKQLKARMANRLAGTDEELFHKIGDTIHAKGVLYDYKDTISFYIYSIRKVKDTSEEIDRHFQMAVLYKSTYPKTIKGFKT